MKIILGVLIAGMLLVPSAKATPTAGGLLELCSSSKEVEVATCLGYVAGWVDALNGTNLAFDKGEVSTVILADGVTNSQIIRVFIKYMSAHPEVENKTAGLGLMGALFDAKLMGMKPVVQASVSH